MKRFIVLGLVIVLLLSVIAGCSTSKVGDDKASSSQTSKVEEPVVSEAPPATAKPLDSVTLKIMVPGDRPADMDKVLTEAEKRMEGTLNVKLDVVFVPWSDLGNKTQVTLASGEPIDLIFDAPWLHLTQSITAGYYEPLDDLLQKYGPDIINTRPQQMWDANKIDGKIMGIPLGNSFYQGKTYGVRKDLREKLGIAPIQSYEDLVKFEYAVKQKYSDIIPFTPSSQDIKETDFRLYFDTEKNNNMRYIPGTATSALYFKNNDGKVYNLFDEMDPIFWGYVQNARKLYQDKIINQDVLATKDPMSLVKKGKVAVTALTDFGIKSDVNAELSKNIPGAELEAVTFFNTTPQKYATDFKMWNFLALPVNSKNKERAIQFLNWANQKDNYDLLAYGIKGQNWDAVGDDKYKTIGTGYAWFPFAWIWNPKLDRMDASLSDDVITLNKYLAVAENFITDKTTGFTFDAKPVQNEIGQLGSLTTKYEAPMYDGVVDPTVTWEKYKKEAGTIVKKVQEEYQKQLDAFLKKE